MKTKEEFFNEIESAELTFAVTLEKKADGNAAATAFFVTGKGASEDCGYFGMIAMTAIEAVMDVMGAQGFSESDQIDAINVLAKEAVKSRERKINQPTRHPAPLNKLNQSD